jgi:hypothetical protein
LKTIWDIAAHLTEKRELKQLLLVYLRTTGNVHGVRPAYQYGSEQMQSIVEKVVAKRTHINDVLKHIRDQLQTLTYLMSVKYLPKRASEFPYIPKPNGGIYGGNKIYNLIIYLIINYLSNLNGGATGIRTLETVSRLHTFQACAFDHSATAP